MTRRVVVVGAGMGGLTAALRLVRHGFEVRVLEARATPGGLASGLEADGLAYDGGPYVLLDRPGLEWALRAVDLVPQEVLDLRRIADVYEVSTGDGPSFRMRDSLEATADGVEANWPGGGARYRAFVDSASAAYRRLSPLLRRRPGVSALLRTGAWRGMGFALRPLSSVLSRSGLPPTVQEALGIWTHIAGQRITEAPSALSLVPALIHGFGAWYTRGGIAAIPRVLSRVAEARGVRMDHGTTVRRIVARGGRVAGVETDGGQVVDADAVVSNAGGVGTYLDLLEVTPGRARRELAALPLQSPGVCAYLAVRGRPSGPYLRFRVGGGHGCRLVIRPSVLDGAVEKGGWWPARLMAPMDHDRAEAVGHHGQADFLDQLLAETWWRDEPEEVRVVGRRVPADWGAEFHLHRDSMNPVMTARLMRKGRLAHRSPYVRGLYLAGSATHPGQWVSFCAISGVLAADCVRDDLR